jgi:hypothetical protein
MRKHYSAEAYCAELYHYQIPQFLTARIIEMAASFLTYYFNRGVTTSTQSSFKLLPREAVSHYAMQPHLGKIHSAGTESDES